jgi:hypothetical protein
VDISQDTKDYFEEKSQRFSFYQEGKDTAVEFIQENNVQDADLCVFLMVGAILWTSAQLGETLSELELFQLLGIDDEWEDDENEMYEAYQGLTELDLEEFLLRVYLDNK